jgi:hypothetical protein
MKKPIVFMLILGMVCIVSRLGYADLNEDSIGYFIAPGVCKGDFDFDGDVDGSDLAIFAADFGRTDCNSDCEGDFNFDGDVDGSDLAIFAADFGRTDCTHLVVVITSPTLSDTGEYTLTGSVLGQAEVTSLSYTVNARPPEFIAPVTNPFTVVLTLDKGVNEIVVTAEDITGNKGANQISVTYRPTSEYLIDEALANGEIDEETALTYKVFAAFGDTRLPTQYAGDDSQVLDSHVMDKIVATWDTLSPQTQAVLDPFFVPPYYEGSWHDLATSASASLSSASFTTAAAPPCSFREHCTESDDWTFLSGINAKIWYLKNNPSDENKAWEVFNEFDTVWSKLTGLMGRMPINDTNDFNNGGDGRLDIALADLSGARGLILNYLPGCKYDSVYIVLNRANSSTAMKATLAHEFMHALQWHYDVSESCLNSGYYWLMEATATWAKDYVYPTNNDEHRFADDFLSKPELSIDSVAGYREYGAYLFPFYLDRLAGNPTAVRRIWEATEKGDSLEALEQGVQNAGMKLDKAWCESVKYNWNRDPVDNYNQIDGLQARATAKTGTLPKSLSLGGVPDEEIEIPVSLPYLSAWYAHYSISDASVRTFVFYNGWTYELTTHDFPTETYGEAYVAEELTDSEKKGLSVQAIVKINGTWRSPEDWTKVPYKSYCRDKEDERIEEIIIIFSNSDIERRDEDVQPKNIRPMIRMSNIGCGDWEGVVNFTRSDSGVQETVTIQNLIWEPTNDMAMDTPNGGSGLVGTFYVLTNGELSWNISGSDGRCVYEGQQHGVNVVDPMTNILQILRFVKDGDGYRSLVLMGFGDMLTREFDYTKTCTDSDGNTTVHNATKTLNRFYVTVKPGSPNDDISYDGLTIQGDGRNTSDEKHISGSWEFSAQSD